MNIYSLLKVMSLILLFCLPLLATAQIDPGCDPAVDPNCVPIDGGLSLLLAAGVGYGIKKVRDARRNSDAKVDG